MGTSGDMLKRVYVQYDYGLLIGTCAQKWTRGDLRYEVISGYQEVSYLSCGVRMVVLVIYSYIHIPIYDPLPLLLLHICTHGPVDVVLVLRYR